MAEKHPRNNLKIDPEKPIIKRRKQYIRKQSCISNVHYKNLLKIGKTGKFSFRNEGHRQIILGIFTIFRH